METFIEKIASVFNVISKNIEYTENVYVVKAKFSIKLKDIPSYDIIKDILNNVRDWDGYLIRYDELVFNKGNTKQKYEEICGSDQFLNDVKVVILINKEKNNNDEISIYCLEKFFEYYDAAIEKLQNDLNNLMNGVEKLKFNVFSDECVCFKSENIYFSSSGTTTKKCNKIKENSRLKKLSNCKEINGNLNVNLLPEDFFLDGQTIKIPNIEIIFDKITMLLLIKYLFEIEKISDGRIEFRINKYSFKKYAEDINELKLNNSLYRIYKFVYNKNSSVDSLIVARKILEEFFYNNQDISKIDDDVYECICYNYSLYVNDKVKDYFKLKEHLNMIISNTNEKNLEAIKNLRNDAFKSVFTLLTAGLSFLITNIISNGNFDKLLDKEYCIIYITIIIIVIFLLIFQYNNTKNTLKIIEKENLEMINSYKNIMISEKIKKYEEIIRIKINVAITSSFKLIVLFIIILLLVIDLILKNETTKEIINYIW